MLRELKTLSEIDATVVTSRTRRNMSRIHGRGNRTTERRFRGALVRLGVSCWVMHPGIPEKPDFFFEVGKVAVYVDGCFWHGCQRCGHVPKTRSAFWQRKFELTHRRDRAAVSSLGAKGYRVIRIWEHDIARDPMRCARRVRDELEATFNLQIGRAHV